MRITLLVATPFVLNGWFVVAKALLGYLSRALCVDAPRHPLSPQLAEPQQLGQLRRAVSLQKGGLVCEKPGPCLTRTYLTICLPLDIGCLAYNFTRHSERNLVRECSRIVSRLIPRDQDAVPSGAHSQFLEDLHGFVKTLIQSVSARDMDVDGVKEGGHGLSFCWLISAVASISSP